MKPSLKPGYAYLLKASAPTWKFAKSEFWEPKVITPDGTESYMGETLVDGVRCNVWMATKGKPKYYAQTALDGGEL